LEWRDYQHGFSQSSVAHAEMYDIVGRTIKSAKILAVLHDHLGRLDHLSMLDLGASTGIITALLGKEFASAVGIDIDRSAITHAHGTNRSANIHFLAADGLRLCFAPACFDVVICNQVYEHVPDREALLDQIHRVLKPGGVCYFGATNRLNLVETHYGPLPFLSIVPKPLAHLYLRVLGRARYYYETHLTVWGLRRLVSRFEVIDYTGRIIADPARFRATDLVDAGSWRQRLALTALRHAYWLFPGYIWLLQKPASPVHADRAEPAGSPSGEETTV
jgi:2-polyprenyl-3-methyl-5-hydroxy-6-metoxy-1,4-benzoquinol methylase